MTNAWTLSLAGLPSFLAYFVAAAIALLVYAFAYTKLTTHNEWALINQGKSSPAIALGGSLIAFALPLSSALVHSVSIVDFLIWALIAFVIQIATYFTVRMFVSNLSERITNNEMSAGIFVATASLAVGLLNAACMAP